MRAGRATKPGSARARLGWPGQARPYGEGGGGTITFLISSSLSTTLNGFWPAMPRAIYVSRTTAARRCRDMPAGSRCSALCDVLVLPVGSLGGSGSVSDTSEARMADAPASSASQGLVANDAALRR